MEDKKSRPISIFWVLIAFSLVISLVAVFGN